MSSPLFQIKTPAKVNLYLEIVGKRDDGYHEIRTVFYPLKELYDIITITHTEKPGVTMTCKAKDIPLDDRNLCVRAALRFAETTGVSPCWHIDLKKNIPIAAGCGGGSSDAAATLLLLNKMHNFVLSKQSLAQIACQLGADVPYFLMPSIMLGEGIGERLTQIEGSLPSHMGILLLNFGFPVSAAWAYRQHTISHEESTLFPAFMTALGCQKTEKLLQNMHNDFDQYLFEKFPILKEMKEFLNKQGHHYVHISGSGPTLFVIDEFEHLHQTYLELANIEKFNQVLWMHIECF